MAVARRTAGWNAAVMTGGETIGKIATLAYTLIAARALSTDAFGALAIALAYAGLLQAFPSWGFDGILIQRSSADSARMGDYLSRTLALRFGIGIPLFVVGGALLALTRPNFSSQAALLLVLAATLGDLYGDAIRSVAAASHNQSGVAIALMLQRIATCVFAVILLQLRVSLVSVTIGYFIGSMVGVVAAWRVCHRLGVRVSRAALTNESLREYFRASTPIGLNLIAGFVLFRLDAILLSWFTSDADVAAYSVAYRLFEAGLVLSWTVGRAVLPTMSETGEPAAVRAGVSASIGTLSFLYAPMIVVFVTKPDELIRLLFGEDYVDASRTALLWLAAGPLVFAIAQNLGYGMLARKGNRQLLYAGLAATIGNLAINVVVLRTYKGAGAAAATLAAYVIEASILGWYLARQRCLPRAAPVLLAPAVGALAMAAVMIVTPVPFLVSVALGAVVFVIVWAIATRWASPDSITLVQPLRTVIAKVPFVGRLVIPARPRPVSERKRSSMQSTRSSLGSLIPAVLRRWWLFVAVFVPILLIAVVYASSLDDVYDSESVVAFSPKTEAALGSDTLRIVIYRYAVVATAPETLDQITAQFPDYSRSELEDAVEATVPAESANVNIVVSLDDPDDAASIANAITTIVIANAEENDALYEGLVVQQAAPPDDPSGPPRTLIVIAGALAALFCGLLAVGIARAARPTVETITELEELAGAPVIGYISPKHAIDEESVAFARAHLVRRGRPALDETGEVDELNPLPVILTEVGQLSTSDVDLLTAFADQLVTSLTGSGVDTEAVFATTLATAVGHPLTAAEGAQVLLLVRRGERSADVTRALSLLRASTDAELAIVAADFV